MSSTLYRNLTVLDSRSPWHNQLVDLRVATGGALVLQAAGKLSPAADEAVTDATGQYLVKGFVDLAAELAQPGHEYRQTLRELAHEAYLGGFSHVVVQPQTDPPIASADVLRSVQALAQGYPVQLLVQAAASHNLEGKELAGLYELHQLGAVAFGEGKRALADAGLLVRALQYIAPWNGLLFQLPLEPSLANGGLANESAVTAGLGLKASPGEAERLQLVKDLELLAYAGGRIHFSPITTAGGVALLREARQRGLFVTASTAPQYLYLTDDKLQGFDTRYKLYPPLRSQADRAALQAAFAEGLFEGIATHHVPGSTEDKEVEYDYARFGAPTLHSAFAVLNTALVATGKLTLAALVDTLSARPRALLGLADAPIDLGYSAPLFILNPTASYQPYRPKPVYNLTDPYLNEALLGTVQPVTSFPK